MASNEERRHGKSAGNCGGAEREPDAGETGQRTSADAGRAGAARARKSDERAERALSVGQIAERIEAYGAVFADGAANPLLEEPDPLQMPPDAARDERDRMMLQSLHASEGRFREALLEAGKALDEPTRRRADQRAVAWSRERGRWLDRWLRRQRDRERAARSAGPPLPGESPLPLWITDPARKAFLNPVADGGGLEQRIRYAEPAGVWPAGDPVPTADDAAETDGPSPGRESRPTREQSRDAGTVGPGRESRIPSAATVARDER